MSRLPFQGPHVFQHAAAGSRLLQLNVATYMQPAWSNFAGSANFRLVAPSWTQRHSKVSSACLALNFSFGGSIGLSGHLGAGECFSCEAQGIFESHVRRKSGPHFLLALATYRCISFRFSPPGSGVALEFLYVKLRAVTRASDIQVSIHLHCLSSYALLGTYPSCTF